jgi:SAM-dependent MidA family methyltransferase
VKEVSELAESKRIRGVIFSNELLDAMPVRRFGWDAERRVWFEWGVGSENGRFVWKRMREIEGAQPASTQGLSIENGLLDVLPDGFILERNVSAEKWWNKAAQVLECGKLVTIDYGLEEEGFLVPERASGTLRAYRNHHASDDLLHKPGEQDLTAHVNFTAIKSVGERNGLKSEEFLSQAKFLTEIASRTWNREAGFGEWTPERKRQFQTLTHPEHLGRPFRVLIQSRK